MDGNSCPQWLAGFAWSVNAVIRQHDALLVFRKMLKAWMADMEAQGEQLADREKRFASYVKKVHETPKLRDSRAFNTSPVNGETDDGLKWYALHGDVWAWIPVEFCTNDQTRPMYVFPLPVPSDRGLTPPERYAALAAVHDVCCNGQEKMSPWPKPSQWAERQEEKRYEMYGILLKRVEELKETDLPALQAFFDQTDRELVTWKTDLLIDELQGWAGHLSGGRGDNWHWAWALPSFQSAFDGRIMSFVNRPGDAVRKQQLEAKYKEALAAVQEMDRQCTLPGLWTGDDCEGPPETDALTDAEDSIMEVRRHVFELCTLIRDRFAAAGTPESAQFAPQPPLPKGVYRAGQQVERAVDTPAAPENTALPPSPNGDNGQYEGRIAVASVKTDAAEGVGRAVALVQSTAAEEENKGTKDKPDDKGFVEDPSDKTAYVPATEIVTDYRTHFPAYKDLTKTLDAYPHPYIRKWRPRQNRLNIHLADIRTYIHSLEPAEGGTIAPVSPRTLVWECKICGADFPDPTNARCPKCNSDSISPKTNQRK